MGEAIVHAPPAATVPVEVHLGDQEPATRIDGLDMRDMSGASSALDAGPEHHGRVYRWLRADTVTTRGGARRPVFRVADVREVLVTAGILRPPGALSERPPVIAVRRAVDLEGGMTRHSHEDIPWRPGLHRWWRDEYRARRGVIVACRSSVADWRSRATGSVDAGTGSATLPQRLR